MSNFCKLDQRLGGKYADPDYRPSSITGPSATGSENGRPISMADTPKFSKNAYSFRQTCQTFLVINSHDIRKENSLASLSF